ncbi:MAG: enoyl-[acyl-carrier-protein] reductase FabK [Lachnospirales bacterium]
MENNAICKLLGIKYPITQGAMAWISESSLASAVSNAGGLGIIASGNAPKEFVVEEIRKCKKLTDKPFAVNIMLLSPFVDDIVDAVCEEGVQVVTTGAGNPAKYMEKFKNANIKVLPVVPSVAIAKKMESIGADAVIAEGMEAGGHIGKLTTMALLPQVVSNVNIPVIGAGGVGDGRGVAAMFCLGADGIQVGTRFLLADECIVHENYKDKVAKATDIDSVITGNITGHPVRVLKNPLATKFLRIEKELYKEDKPDFTKIEELGAGALRLAVVDGDIKNGSVMAGQIAGLVDKRQSCKDIIEELFEECDKILK